MKRQNGVTLISLTIYVIVMTIVVAVISMISSYFYTNTSSLLGNMNTLTQYTKFNSFFAEEINKENIKVLECKSNYIVFDNGVQYTYIEQNNGIYKDKVKITSNVEHCEFAYQIQNGKDVVTVKLTMDGSTPKNIDFTLNN
ncbi:MAG: hypothetical protein HFJ34_04660 [Clostridia bacterium]|nr:hypothetical protein [Clostridia bacterium]